VLYWIRVIVANRMAESGPQWAEVFSRYNSGTYNNQWFVVDYKLFVSGQPLANNTLYVLEQIPGYIHTDDATQILTFGYWPSYNIPYFDDIFVMSGFPMLVEEYGITFTHQRAPRANIFRRDQYAVQDIDAMKAIMQYNNWANDSYSLGDPCNQISSRCDIASSVNTDPAPFGGADSKIVNSEMITNLTCWAISGPTHQSLPPFDWNNWPGVPHDGQPTVFNFDWILIDL